MKTTVVTCLGYLGCLVCVSETGQNYYYFFFKSSDDKTDENKKKREGEGWGRKHLMPHKVYSVLLC